jgi:transposase
MVHAHGRRAQRLTARTSGVPLQQLVAVAIDVGKSSAAAMACDFTGQVLVPPFEFTMSRPGVDRLVERVEAGLPSRVRLIRVGVEAAGHYHLPLVAAGVLPAGWELVELNPAHVTAQRRVNGSRGVKTDAVDMVAICDLLLAGHGNPVGRIDDVLVELCAQVAHRRRRVDVRTATKNQLQAQVDRAFPGLAACLSSVTDTKVGRLVVTEFADPARLARLGVERFRAFAARRDVVVQAKTAQRLVTAAKAALPVIGAAAARQVLVCDLALLAALDTQIAQAEERLSGLLPATPYQVLTSVPGWGVLRAAAYAAAVGDPDRWPSHRQVYRAGGLTPVQYESAGRRRDGGISREGSVELRRALLDMGVGLWHSEPSARAYAAGLRARGKPGGVIVNALAHRAGRIAFAMVRDQTVYDPDRWR